MNSVPNNLTSFSSYDDDDDDDTTVDIRGHEDVWNDPHAVIVVEGDHDDSTSKSEGAVHPGTHSFSKKVSRYAKQYEKWSEDVFEHIYREGFEFFVVMEGSSEWYRRATHQEIYEYTEKLFQASVSPGTAKKKRQKVSPKKQLPKKQKSSIASKTKKVTTTKEAKNNSYEVRKNGTRIFAFEQVWEGCIIDVREESEGKEYKCQWKGFDMNDGEWISEYQLVSVNERSLPVILRLCHETFSKNTVENSDKEDSDNKEEEEKRDEPSRMRRRVSDTESTSSGEDRNMELLETDLMKQKVSPKQKKYLKTYKPRKVTSKEEYIHYPEKGTRIFAFEQVWEGHIVEVSEVIGGNEYKIRWKGFAASKDQWVSEHQLIPVNKKSLPVIQRLARETHSNNTVIHSDKEDNDNEKEEADDDEENSEEQLPRKRRRASDTESASSEEDRNLELLETRVNEALAKMEQAEKLILELSKVFTGSP